MMRILQKLMVLLVFTSVAHAAPGEKSFTPNSVLIPIREIGIVNATTLAEVPLYTCGPTDAACMVDITDQSALSALFPSSFSIAPATYDKLYVSNCTSTGYTAQFRGEALTAGTNYYTRPGADPLTTNSADQGYVSVNYNGCKKHYTLPTPLVLTAGNSFALGLVVSVRNIAWLKLGPKTIPSGCFEDATHSHSACMAYPDIIPAIGDVTTTSIEHYLVGEFFGATEPVLVGYVQLVVDAANNLLAGFTRRAFSNSSAAASGNFDTAFKTMTDLGGGNYYLENYGSTAGGTGYVRFTAFRRANHSATYLNNSGTPVNYVAFRDYTAELPDCPAGAFLDASFVSTPADYSQIVPLGNLNPSGHTFPTDHIYFYMNLGGGGIPIVTPVHVPGAGWITEIIESQSWDTVPPADPLTPDHVDYNVVVAFCHQLSMKYGHIQSLSPVMNTLLTTLKSGGSGSCDEYATGGRSYKNCRYSTLTAVTSGQQIGNAGGAPGYFGWDLWTYDARITPIKFANPSRYFENPNGDDSFHIVCGLDYLIPAIKTPLYGLISRTDLPICGTTAQDLPGTIQGNWFQLASSTYPEDQHIALVHDNFDPGKAVFSVGTTVPTLPSGAYYFTPTFNLALRINRDFSTINDGQVYCFDNLTDRFGGAKPNVTILAKLNTLATPHRMTIEKKVVANCAVLGSPATWSFSVSNKVFER